MNQEPEEPTRVMPVTWADRVIYPLSAWLLVLTVLAIPGLIIVALVLPADTVRLVARLVLVAAVLTDVMSVYLDVTYLLRGGGVHGIGLFALGYYTVFVVFGMSAPWWWRLAAMAGLFVFHVVCHWQVAGPIARRLGWRPEEPSEDGEGREITWVDYYLIILRHWCLAVAAMGIPGVIIATLFLPPNTARLAARCVFAAAILSDMTSIYEHVWHLLHVGLPAELRAERPKALFALGYYVVFVIVGMSAAWWWRLAALAGLLIFHLACHDYLPRPIARRMGWRPDVDWA